MKKIFTLLIALTTILFISCKTNKITEQTDIEEYSEGVPDDIVELMNDIEGFNPDRDFYEITLLTDWIIDEGNEYGLIDAEVVNFEWEDYSGTQRTSVYRDFDLEKKYTNYNEWLETLNIKKNLVDVIIENDKDIMLSLSRYLKFPIKFSYTLEFEDNVIHTFTNNESNGREKIPIYIVPEAGIYKLNYDIDGFKSEVKFLIKK